MVAGIIAFLTVAGTGYYLYRLAPRVLARAAHQAAPPLAYQRYVHGFEQRMTEREALLILGFAEGEGVMLQRPLRDTVRARYHRVMSHLHSDVDGSPYIAAKINEARDVLLRP